MKVFVIDKNYMTLLAVDERDNSELIENKNILEILEPPLIDKDGYFQLFNQKKGVWEYIKIKQAIVDKNNILMGFITLPKPIAEWKDLKLIEILPNTDLTIPKWNGKKWVESEVK